LYATKFFTLLWGVAILLLVLVPWKFDSIGKHHWIYILRNRFRDFLVGFISKMYNPKLFFYSAVISQLTIFIIYYYAIYIFPSGRKTGLPMVKF
jgi:hypothetical protein